jgi:hypothetical protein
VSRDGWVEIAVHLRPEQAGMLHGLLRSAGVEALVENLASAGLNLGVTGALGGAKVLVHADDAQRASEIYAASGVFSTGAHHGEEIPEEEWSRSAPEKVDGTAPSVEPPGPGADHASAASPWALSPDDRLLMRLIRAIFRLFT